MKYRKNILEYARQHERASDFLKIKRYHVPDAKVKSVPMDSLEDVDEIPKGDGKRWEDDRLAAAIAKYGAKDKVSCVLKSFTNNDRHVFPIVKCSCNLV